jgi:hypothetical protein
LDGLRLQAGDAVGMVDPGTVVVQAMEASEVLAFDLR